MFIRRSVKCPVCRDGRKEGWWVATGQQRCNALKERVHLAHPTVLQMSTMRRKLTTTFLEQQITSIRPTHLELKIQGFHFRGCNLSLEWNRSIIEDRMSCRQRMTTRRHFQDSEDATVGGFVRTDTGVEVSDSNAPDLGMSQMTKKTTQSTLPQQPRNDHHDQHKPHASL